jgi:DNA-binding CsgD family transcriptional regulator
MSTILCVLLWALLIPIGIVLWLSESRQQRIKRWHQVGASQAAIARKLNLSRYQVRKALLNP